MRVLCLALALAGCYPNQEPAADADVCTRAAYLVSSCGFDLPTLDATTTACTGGARIVATCVVDHARDCDELATLTRRIDQCANDLVDGGGLIAPPSDLPAPERASKDGGS